jgi:AcrR family transcriptional regulator
MEDIMYKKKEIIMAANALFSKKGYNLSMSEIANLVQLKTPSLYSHFISKDEIVEVMIKEELDNYYGQMRITVENMNFQTSREYFEGYFLFVLDYFMQYNRLTFWKYIPIIENDDLRSKFKSLLQEQDIIFYQRIKLWLKKGIENGEIKKNADDGAIYLYLVMLQGALDAMLFHQNREFINESAIKLFNAYWDGISTENLP